MSLLPDVITQEQVIEQMTNLRQINDQLKVHKEQLEHKLKMIEQSLAENDQLRAKGREYLVQSLELFELEWKRKSEFYPDIRRASLQKISELFAPQKKQFSKDIKKPTPPTTT